MEDEFAKRMLDVLDGSLLTIAVALVSVAISLFLGLLTATAKLSGSRAARVVAATYTTVIRGVPDLVLMLLIFFGGQLLVNDIGAYFEWDYIDIDPFIAGTITIGFIFGAYMGETFRGAILAVPVGLLEAGYAYGMSKPQDEDDGAGCRDRSARHGVSCRFPWRIDPLALPFLLRGGVDLFDPDDDFRLGSALARETLQRRRAEGLNHGFCANPGELSALP